MAKNPPHDAEDESKPLAERVSDWLSTQGYPLEYKTWHALNAVQLNPTLGEYSEADDGKRRELDVCASLGTGWEVTDTGTIPPRSHRFEFQARLICECKYSKGRPWLLMQSHVGTDTWQRWWTLPKSPTLRGYLRTDIAGCSGTLDPAPHVRDRPVAHSIVQAFSHNDAEKNDARDKAFSSLRKIADAAWDLCEAPFRNKPAMYSGVGLVVVPALVVDGPLMSAAFDPRQGKFVAEPVNQGRLIFQGSRNITAVDVVHVDSLEHYARQTQGTLTALQNAVAHLTRTRAPSPKWEITP